MSWTAYIYIFLIVSTVNVCMYFLIRKSAKIQVIKYLEAHFCKSAPACSMRDPNMVPKMKMSADKYGGANDQ